jgi:hypothetical protein
MSGNLLAGLQGQLAPDVSRTIIDAANARAFAGGFGGSPLAGNLTARDLGLTSKQIQDQAFNQFLNFIPVQSRTATLDPALKSSISQYNSVLDAMPNPAARGEFFLDQQKQILQQSQPQQSPFSSSPIPSGGMPNFGPSWTGQSQMGVQPLPAGYSGTFGPSTSFPAPSLPPVFSSSQAQWNNMSPVQAAARDMFSYNLGNGSNIYSQPQTFRNTFESGINPFETSYSPPQSSSGFGSSGWADTSMFSDSIFGGDTSASGVLKSAGININDYIAPF